MISPMDLNMSLPAWGEWIEISLAVSPTTLNERLSPHGESGLKLLHLRSLICPLPSLPAWGEWIEIRVSCVVPL